MDNRILYAQQIGLTAAMLEAAKQRLNEETVLKQRSEVARHAEILALGALVHKASKEFVRVQPAREYLKPRLKTDRDPSALGDVNSGRLEISQASLSQAVESTLRTLNELKAVSTWRTLPAWLVFLGTATYFGWVIVFAYPLYYLGEYLFRTWPPRDATTIILIPGALGSVWLIVPALLVIGLVSVGVLLRGMQKQENYSKLQTTLQQQLGRAGQIHSKLEEQALANHEHSKAKIAATEQAQTRKIQAEYARAINEIERHLASYIEGVHRFSPAWNHKAWNAIVPSINASTVVRLGHWTTNVVGRAYTYPAVFPVPGERGLLFETDGAHKEQAIESIQSIVLHALAALPPGKVRLTFIDPVGLGQNVAAFMRLADFDEALVANRVWTEPAHIEQRLADLTLLLENVIQKYLRNQYQTIEAYNEQAGEIAEPYRLLVVLDFPLNFSVEAARRLLSIAKNGPRCGVYPLVVLDSQKPVPHGFDIGDLHRVMDALKWSGDRFVWDAAHLSEAQLSLEKLPPADQIERILAMVGSTAKGAAHVLVPFDRIAPDVTHRWQSDSRTGLAIPLGPSGARRIQALELGHGTAQHVLIVGKTGSGKSTLLHTIIINAALLYGPDQLAMYLIDFKKGVEFKAYATGQLPHARVIAIESEREFGLSVIEGVDAEMTRRGQLFRSAGVGNLADYLVGGPEREQLPRILLLVDEFQEFFSADDTLSTRVSQILDRLVRQGRGFGIHVILGSQTLSGSYNLTRSTIDQMAVRIALQCSEADSRLILADDNPAARLLSRPGEAIYNNSNGLVEGNDTFQVARLEDSEREAYLDEIRAMTLTNRLTLSPPLVFEGNAPADLRNNVELHNFIGSRVARTAIAYPQIWLGESVAIRPTIQAQFRRQSGSNLMIVGPAEAGETLVLLSILSFCLTTPQHPSPNDDVRRPSVHLLDLSATEAGPSVALQDLSNQLPGQVTVARRRHLPRLLSEIAATVKQRQSDESFTAPAELLIINGLHRAREVHLEDYLKPTPSENPSPSEALGLILRDGPEVGVHTVVWGESMTALGRILDRGWMREFSARLAFQMSAEDSGAFLDSPQASRLGPFRALFLDEETGVLEKLRPYANPEPDWLAWAVNMVGAAT